MLWFFKGQSASLWQSIRPKVDIMMIFMKILMISMNILMFFMNFLMIMMTMMRMIMRLVTLAAVRLKIKKNHFENSVEFQCKLW